MGGGTRYIVHFPSILLRKHNTFLIGILISSFVLLCPFFTNPLHAQPTINDIIPGQLIIKIKTQSGLSATGVPQSNTTHIQTLSSLSYIKTITSISKQKNTPLSASSTQSAPSNHLINDSIYRIEITPEQDPLRVVKDLEEHSFIDYAEPEYIVTMHSLPNDPYLHHQSYLNINNFDHLFNWESEHEVIVAVIDSGVDHTHQDLNEKIHINEKDTINNIDDDNNGLIDDKFGYNFHNFSSKNDAKPNIEDTIGHGTHIAGIIAADQHNNLGIAGINPKAKILNIRFLDDTGKGSQVNAALAIRYAVNMGARIINCSWGYPYYNTILKEAIDYAHSKDVIIIASSGNDSWNTPDYPAGFDSVISVGSVNNSHDLSYFSNWGPTIDFVAIGSSVYSTVPNNTYSYKSGTSQSAAIVSGIASLVLSLSPQLTPKELLTIMKDSTDDLFEPGVDEYSGHGIINIKKLEKTLLASSHILSETTHSSLRAQAAPSLKEVLHFPNPIRSPGTHFGFETNRENIPVHISIYDLRGMKVKEITDTTSTGYNKILWNADNDTGQIVENGTYFYVITLENGQDSIRKKGKLSVLR